MKRHVLQGYHVNPVDPVVVARYCQQFGIHPLLATVMVSRQYAVHEVQAWLYPQTVWHEPFALEGMARTVARIRHALARQERILIFGDYDADGVCSVALMTQLMRTLGAYFRVAIPHRHLDGYGLNRQAIKHAHDEGCRLIITVDTGISAHEPIDYARELGIDVLVTDHHQPPDVLPHAYAIINPQQKTCTYPYRHLAGVGVALKLAHALLGRVPYEWTPFAATGTVADLMPLTGENRVIVQCGLAQMNAQRNVWLDTVLHVAGVSVREPVTAQTLAFTVVPRLNAAGRLEKADDAVRLLLAEDAVHAKPFAQKLERLNQQRKQLVDETTQQALHHIQTGQAYAYADALVVGSSQWNPGVIGIVASRLVEQTGVPTIVFAIDEVKGVAKGSARSIGGVHLYDAIQQCSEHVLYFGGHESAAGMTVAHTALSSFSRAFDLQVHLKMTAHVRPSTFVVDATMCVADLTLASIKELDRLAPYGMHHPIPTIVLKNVTVDQVKPLGREGKHFKGALCDPTGAIEGVQFHATEEHALRQGSRKDVVVELAINRYRGSAKPQAIIKHIFAPAEDTAHAP